MPRKFLMSPTFKGRHARWRKLYKGVAYTVNCSDLGLPEELWTELGSYQAANEWWVQKRAELDSGVRPVPPEVERVIKTLRTKKAVLAAEGKDTHFVESQIGLTQLPFAAGEHGVERGTREWPRGGCPVWRRTN